MADRGIINNRERARQIIDYSGLRYGKIIPTDIDGFIDFGNKLFIYLEFKYGEAEFVTGQRLAIERAVKASRVPCYALLCRHNISDPKTDIDAAIATVDIYYTQKDIWIKPKEVITTRKAIDILLAR